MTQVISHAMTDGQCALFEALWREAADAIDGQHLTTVDVLAVLSVMHNELQTRIFVYIPDEMEIVGDSVHMEAP